MLQGIPASLCNASCMANEQSWAYATLSQPANTTSSCNVSCQAAHDSFISSIQTPVFPSTSKRHRSLMQATPTCTPGEPCPACDPVNDPEFCTGCNCTSTFDIFGSLGTMPATCGSAPIGTHFGLDANGCPVAPQPYTPPVIPGQCENPPAITCDKCLNGNDLAGNPVTDSTSCSDPVYDDPPPSGKLISYICDTCGDSYVGLNHGPCGPGSTGYVCAGNG